ncbi:hypothetical protein C8R44DRAFT_880848 [Mycena epipterygia]|nr:hypothetical protein C8R44DRAFT_880848 [Mycena epipterygia]
MPFLVVLSRPALHPTPRVSMPSFSQIAMLTAVVLAALSNVAPVAVPRHTMASLPAILMKLTALPNPSVVVSVRTSSNNHFPCSELLLASININNTTLSILSAAMSEASALVGSPPSTILSTERCACGRTYSSSDDNSLSAPDGFFSVPEDGSDILSVTDLVHLRSPSFPCVLSPHSSAAFPLSPSR